MSPCILSQCIALLLFYTLHSSSCLFSVHAISRILHNRVLGFGREIWRERERERERERPDRVSGGSNMVQGSEYDIPDFLGVSKYTLMV